MIWFQQLRISYCAELFYGEIDFEDYLKTLLKNFSISILRGIINRKKEKKLKKQKR